MQRVRNCIELTQDLLDRSEGRPVHLAARQIHVPADVVSRASELVLATDELTGPGRIRSAPLIAATARPMAPDGDDGVTPARPKYRDDPISFSGIGGTDGELGQ